MGWIFIPPYCALSVNEGNYVVEVAAKKLSAVGF
jgi:hypothetical protein